MVPRSSALIPQPLRGSVTVHQGHKNFRLPQTVSVEQCCRGAKEACSLSMWYADQTDDKEVSEQARLRDAVLLNA